MSVHAFRTEPGDVVYFGGHIIHWSFTNESDRPRRSFVGHYCNARSWVPWNHGQPFEGGPIELIGPAETVHHAGLSPLGIRVPDALGEAVVGDRRAVAILPLGDAQIHAAPIAGSTVPCNGRVAESCA